MKLAYLAASTNDAMARFVFFLCLLFIASFASAQTDSIHRLRLGLTGSANRTGSGTNFLFANDVRFSIEKKTRKLNTGANWIYGTQGNNLTNNDFLASADFNLYPDSAKHYFWGLANFTSSFSLKIRTQWQAGLGVAYDFINQSNEWLNLSDGLVFERSELSAGDPNKRSYQTVRNSLRLSFRFPIGALLTLTGTHFLQNALNNRQDYIIRSNTRLQVKLTRWLSVENVLTYNQFRRTGQENLLFTYGIAAEKRF